VKLHYAGLHQYDASVTCDQLNELDKDLHAIQDTYINNRGEFLVVECDGCIIGMGALKHVDSVTGEIKRMRVDKECQKKGIGQRLLDRLTETAKKLKYRYLVLDTTVQQEPAQKLYKRNGFHEYKRRKLYGSEYIFYRKQI
jgi:ribosomal protein S18 acetylase RimI-like enzyme